jgi:hypothetical protein
MGTVWSLRPLLNGGALRTYRVFISHAWDYKDDYYRCEKFLNEAPNFEWENLSVPKHAPIKDADRLAQEFRIRYGRRTCS